MPGAAGSRTRGGVNSRQQAGAVRAPVLPSSPRQCPGGRLDAVPETCRGPNGIKGLVLILRPLLRTSQMPELISSCPVNPHSINWPQASPPWPLHPHRLHGGGGRTRGPLHPPSLSASCSCPHHPQGTGHRGVHSSFHPRGGRDAQEGSGLALQLTALPWAGGIHFFIKPVLYLHSSLGQAGRFHTHCTCEETEAWKGPRSWSQRSCSHPGAPCTMPPACRPAPLGPPQEGAPQRAFTVGAEKEGFSPGGQAPLGQKDVGSARAEQLWVSSARESGNTAHRSSV